MTTGSLILPGNFNNNAAGIGTFAELIPSVCRSTHYFSYGVTAVTAARLTATAIRCTGGGKVPDATSALTLLLISDFGAGTDNWTGTGGY